VVNFSPTSIKKQVADGRRGTTLCLSAFDELRAALVANRPQFYRDITLPFYGYNRPGAKSSEGIREHWWFQDMMGSVKAHYDCIKAFSETDAV
jgi:non-heme chloroperoxidase